MCNLHCNHYHFYFIFFQVIFRLSTLIDHISVGRRLEVVSGRYTPQQLSLTDDTRVLRFLNPFLYPIALVSSTHVIAAATPRLLIIIHVKTYHIVFISRRYGQLKSYHRQHRT